MPKISHSSRTHPTLERSPRKNWVEKVGGLPDYIERVAKHIFYDNVGYTISRAIAAAISQIKKWAAKGNAKAIRALAQWNAKKARSGNTNLSDEQFAEILVDLAMKNSEAAGGKNKIGAKSAGVTSAEKLRAQVQAYKRNKSQYSPEQQKKIEARLKSSAQRLGVSISLSKEFPASDFHPAHSGQKCSRWQHDISVPAVKCREVNGKHLGACATHAKEMTKGKDVNMSEGPKGTDASKHDLIFFSKRSTPKVVPHGQKFDAPEGYGSVVKRRPATAQEEAQIRKGKWVRVDASGNKPSDKGYKKTKYRPQLVNNSSEPEGTSEEVNLALGTGRSFDETKHVRAAGGRFGSKGGKSSSGASNNSATSQEVQDFPSLVQTLKPGQSVTLPKTKVKIRKVPNGYQVYDGKTNVVVKTADAAIARAQGLARSRSGNRHDSN